MTNSSSSGSERRDRLARGMAANRTVKGCRPTPGNAFGQCGSPSCPHKRGKTMASAIQGISAQRLHELLPNRPWAEGTLRYQGADDDGRRGSRPGYAGRGAPRGGGRAPGALRKRCGAGQGGLVTVMLASHVLVWPELCQRCRQPRCGRPGSRVPQKQAGPGKRKDD